MQATESESRSKFWSQLSGALLGIALGGTGLIAIGEFFVAQSQVPNKGTTALISGIVGGALLAGVAGWVGYRWYTERRARALQNSSQAL